MRRLKWIFVVLAVIAVVVVTVIKVLKDREVERWNRVTEEALTQARYRLTHRLLEDGSYDPWPQKDLQERDGSGNQLEVTYFFDENGKAIGLVVKSAGPDKIMGTDDDIPFGEYLNETAK